MSFTADTRDRTRPLLPLAAMVDVLFLLLIFFMTASVFREAELRLDVELPTAETAEPGSSAATHILLSVREDGRVFLGERETPLSELKGRLAALAEQFPEETVIVRGDRDASYGLAVRVMDLAQQAGLRNVSLAAVRPAEELDSP